MVPISALLRPGSCKDRLDQKCGGALAVCAGDPDDRDPLGRMLEEILADARQSPASVRNQGPRNSFAWLFGRRIGDDSNGSGLNGLIDEAVPVGGLAMHGHK